MTALDPAALECLATIVEEGGFERAALRLCITQSAVSQRLRALEEDVGTVLIVRSRPLRTTAAGRLLLKHALQLRLLRSDLSRELRALAADSSRGDERLSIAVNADSIATWALPALSPLAVQGLGLEIIADDQDFTFEWLREGRVLGCVTTSSAALRGCRVQPLGAMAYVAVASPEFLARQDPQALTAQRMPTLPFVAFNRKDDLQGEFAARVAGLPQVVLQQLFVPSTEGQVQAALAGWGVAVVPELKVRPLLEQGRLLQPWPQHRLSVPLFWHCWNLQAAVLQQLSDHIQAAARAVLT